MQTLGPSIFSDLVSSSVKTVLLIALRGVVNNIVVRSRDRLPRHPHPCVTPAQDVLSSQRRQNGCNCAKYDKPQNKIEHDICSLNSETWAAVLWVWQTCCVRIILNTEDEDKLYGLAPALDDSFPISVCLHQGVEVGTGVAGLLSPKHWWPLSCSDWLKADPKKPRGLLVPWTHWGSTCWPRVDKKFHPKYYSSVSNWSSTGIVRKNGNKFSVRGMKRIGFGQRRFVDASKCQQTHGQNIQKRLRDSVILMWFLEEFRTKSFR